MKFLREDSNLPIECHGNFNTLADSNTVGIAENIYRLTKKEAYVVIANYHRKQVD
jgi:hypothetical protein